MEKILIERGVKPEIEVFDKGMVDYAIRFQKQGFIQKPMHFDFVLGVQMAASARDLVFMVEVYLKVLLGQLQEWEDINSKWLL